MGYEGTGVATPVTFDASLAEKVSVNESIVLQKLHELLTEDGTLEGDGTRLWVRVSAKEMAALFPFWSPATVLRLTNVLRYKGIILADNFNDEPLDRTNWYTIDHAALARLEKGGRRGRRAA